MCHVKCLFLCIFLFFEFSLCLRTTEYSVFFKSTNLDLLVGEEKKLELFSPRTQPDDESIRVKFVCVNSDSDTEFNWNSTDSHCTVVGLMNGTDYDVSNSPLTITLKGLKAGKQQLVGNARLASNDSAHIDDSKAFVSVSVGKSNAVLLISSIVGWIYFVSWSISFYPQIFDNWRRKSVAGYSIDYAVLNITGYISYSVFNVSLFFLHKVQQEYEAKNRRSLIPVEFNDVVFGLHGIMCCSFLLFQFVIYERGHQRVSLFARVFLIVVWLGYPVLCGITAFTDLLSLLQLIYIFSYVKLAVTLVKYIPQGYYNYKRQSTVGWSIIPIFLDITGGTLSMVQIFMLAYNYDNWASIFNNLTKFGLGLFSILFDVFFMVQHYILYNHSY